MRLINFIDLFAGIGGIRLGFENACKKLEIESRCVFTSEIKLHARKILAQNHPSEEIFGDIRTVDAKEIPDFDFLLGGFPCQAFSLAGKRLGFQDTRGTLFFEVERILKEKQPFGFILENVEGLVIHDRENPKERIGRTLATILSHLEELGYKVSWKVLNASDFGIPQNRRRIYIVGTRLDAPNLDGFPVVRNPISSILKHGLPCGKSEFINKLLENYSVEELEGKTVTNKRGGENSIHGWNLGIRGETTKEQQELLSAMLLERRKRSYANELGIPWKDGMPLTFQQIQSFCKEEDLQQMLDDLVKKRYLCLKPLKTKEEPSIFGYDIVGGKMSFEVGKILSPNDVAPTLVASDMDRLFVADGGGLRRLTLREGLRLFGYPEDFKFEINEKDGYDLLGNTVVVPVIEAVSSRVLEVFLSQSK